jgi:hypothetical protein
MKPPTFLVDLYGDLRDRKLLPLVVVLVLATIAVPVILKNETPPPPEADPAAANADLPGAMPTAAVMVSDPGLRDYRERLNQLRSKDPFEGEKVEAPDLSESSVRDVSGGGSGASATAASTGGSTGSASTEGSFSESVTASTSTETTTTTQTTGGNGSNGGSGSEDERQWFTYRIDVLTGPAGHTQRRQNVERYTVLPSRSNPVALFLGAQEGGKRANLMVSTDVVDSRGDGTCLPDPSDCQFLTLKVGDERKFEYAPSGEPDTFVIEIKDIRLVAIDDPREPPASEPQGRGNARAGVESFLGL